MKRKFKFFCIISVLMIMFAFSQVFAASVQVQINGETMKFVDAKNNIVEARIMNDRTMVPLRGIFEKLGATVNFESKTKTITAITAEKQITLVVNNEIANVKNLITNEEENVKLDAVPVIVNDSTLVPLRFIAQSLGKQVGWDSSAYTAIIIDYDYFSDLIKQKNISLYNILTSKDNNISFSVTKEYIDNSNSTNNNTASIQGSTINNNGISNVTLNFEGTNELIQEIKTEGWGNISYNVKYDENKISINTSNATLMQMLELEPDIFNSIQIKDLDLTGDFNDNLGDAIRSIFNVDESKINVATFNNMKTAFNEFIGLFITNGTRTLNYNNANLEMFDYTRFDNIVYANELSRILSFINKEIFNYDVVQDELLYDWNKITYNMNCQNNSLVLKITLENEYNEKVNYTILYESN